MKPVTGKRRLGRPPKDRSRSEILFLQISKSEFPNIEDMLHCKNPKELYEKYGIDLPRDLIWPRTLLKGTSLRSAAILECLARGLLNNKEKKEGTKK